MTYKLLRPELIVWSKSRNFGREEILEYINFLQKSIVSEETIVLDKLLFKVLNSSKNPAATIIYYVLLAPRKKLLIFQFETIK
jgi:hypothetical protein